MSSRFGNLAVKGAKFSRRASDDDEKGTIQDERKYTQERPVPDNSQASQLHPAGQLAGSSEAYLQMKKPPPSNSLTSSNTASETQAVPNSTPAVESKGQEEKYWKMSDDEPRNEGDVVIIHVCDENQQISKDFCCKRDILVKHMKYFEKFLAENENGYDDIDISVHCDVEIFEWLMTYIHEPDNPPKVEKSIIVSILISSEFLQMDSLVELCIQHVANNLSEIIKLPIDLSCISEKLINRIASITQPKTLSETRDRKDKILTKLYKRRVELDFSRKGSTGRSGPAGVASTSSSATSNASATRTIAASLTCCSHCGLVYLDNYVSYLSCKKSPPTVDFRGQLASRHSAIVGWSLTFYLKTLHSGGMGWDAIYWHVWAACVVFRVDDVMISALEVDRYSVEPDGLLIKRTVPRENEIRMNGTNGVDSSTMPSDVAASSPGIDGKDAASIGSTITSKSSSNGSPLLPPKAPYLFSLSQEDDGMINMQDGNTCKLFVNPHPEALIPVGNPAITPSLNPLRPPSVLAPLIFDLICTQMKYIVGIAHKPLIQKTAKSVVDSAKHLVTPPLVDFGEILWGNPSRRRLLLRNAGAGNSSSLSVASAISEDSERRRGRSPGRVTRNTPEASRKYSQSLPKGRPGGGTNNGGNGVPRSNTTIGIAGNDAGNNTGSSSNDGGGGSSDQENPQQQDGTGGGRPPVGGSVAATAASAERRTRSSSTGNRFGGSITSVGDASTKTTSPSSSTKKSFGPAAAVVVDDDLMSGETLINNIPVDAATAKQISVLQSLPPEVQYRIHQTKGPVHGLWMIAHPLQIRSNANKDMLQMVSESTLPPNKKIEWELDIMREYDEKRMEQFEKFLVSRRNKPAETNFDVKRSQQQAAQKTQQQQGGRSNARSGGGRGGASSGGGGASATNSGGGGSEYYKDRGRQINR
mmetsp:Transcript_3749/g.5862  ORF Transcript_3749/g.5862 Transcript_3749/m.5862 type:complete len:925 (+) Transcript_3749:62-2836(+)